MKRHPVDLRLAVGLPGLFGSLFIAAHWLAGLPSYGLVALWILVVPVTIIIGLLHLLRRRWRSVLSCMVAIGVMFGMMPTLELAKLELELSKVVPAYDRALARLPPDQRHFRAFLWGGGFGQTGSFFIYTDDPQALMQGRPAHPPDTMHWGDKAVMQDICRGRTIRLRPRFFWCDPYGDRTPASP
jgi:hypothetical protein